MIEVQVDLKFPSASKLAAAFREVRDKYIAEGGERLHQTVESSIRMSGMTIRSGDILSWQTPYPSKGYTAVRPTNTSTGANSPGAITNYLESGHKIRGVSGTAMRYRPRIHVPRVTGFRFYESARAAADKITGEIAARCADEVAKKIEQI